MKNLLLILTLLSVVSFSSIEAVVTVDRSTGTYTVDPSGSVRDSSGN